jgi:hypothetical protein
MFIVVGLVGLALFAASLFLDDFLHDLVPDVEHFSGLVIGAGLAGFGALGWFVGARLDSPGPIALLAGLAGGLLVGALASTITASPGDS